MIINPLPVVRNLGVDPIQPLPPTPNTPAHNSCQVYLVSGWLQPHERSPTITLTSILALHTACTQLVLGQTVTDCFSASVECGKWNIHLLENICQVQPSLL